MTDKIKRFPTADEVARAIIVACKMTHCAYPLVVAVGGKTRGGPHGYLEMSRARVYAAWALDETFAIGPQAASRLCGSSRQSWGSHLAVARSQLRHGSLKWFDPEVLVRVKAALVPAAETSIVNAVVRELVPMAQPRIAKVVRQKIFEREAEGPSFGDPPLARSALAGAKPWVPYEQRDGGGDE